MRKATGRERPRGKNQELSSGHTGSDIYKRRPAGNAEETTGYISSKSRKEDRTTNINVCAISKSI